MNEMNLNKVKLSIKNKKHISLHLFDDFLQINSKYIGGKVVGYEIILRITHNCNITCEYCPVSLNKGYYNLEFIKQVISYINFNHCELMISGGEPSIHPDFFDLLQYLNSTNFKRIGVQTNAIIFCEKNNIRKINFSKVLFFVSLSSASKKEYGENTNSAFYDQAVNGIKNLTKEGLTIINYVVYKNSYKSIRQLFDLRKNVFNPSNTLINFSNLLIPHAFEYKNKLVRYNEIFLKLKKYLNKNKNNSFIQFTTSGPCSFPLCVLSIIINDIKCDLFKVNNDLVSIGKLEKQFYKNNLCSKCNYNDYCQGFLKEYVELYGDSEIKPILD